ncbi:helix-turn-helix domain-containing protein [Kitasatospora sp. NPDC127060]|uniref:helix-turn-helix domain-containing protein n=1 Tax=Kitasatospora sp. NPDC127060 TaxID=3347121 RepID=UPI0036663B4F
MTQILRCVWCQAPFTRPQRRGRTPSYCRTRCQQQADRARKGTPADRSVDDLVGALAREHLALARRLAQAAAAVAAAQPGEDVQAVLALIDEAEEDLEDLRAHVVLQARARKLPWAAIGQLTGRSADTARRRWDEAYAARRRVQRQTRSQRAQLAGEAIAVPAAPAGPAAAGRRNPEDGQSSAVAPTAASRHGLAESLPAFAAAKLASALSFLQRRSGRSARELAAAAGLSASKVSRMFVGDRVPSWPVTQALVEAVGGHPAEIRPLWEAACGLLPERPFDATPVVEAQYVASFVAAVRGLHLAAFAPDPLSISHSSKGRVSPQTATDLLSGNRVPSWPTVEAVLEVLHADPALVLPLWERVQLARHRHTYTNDYDGPPAEAFG